MPRATASAFLLIALLVTSACGAAESGRHPISTGGPFIQERTRLESSSTPV